MALCVEPHEGEGPVLGLAGRQRHNLLRLARRGAGSGGCRTNSRRVSQQQAAYVCCGQQRRVWSSSTSEARARVATAPAASVGRAGSSMPLTAHWMLWWWAIALASGLHVMQPGNQSWHPLGGLWCSCACACLRACMRARACVRVGAGRGRVLRVRTCSSALWPGAVGSISASRHMPPLDVQLASSASWEVISGTTWSASSCPGRPEAVHTHAGKRRYKCAVQLHLPRKTSAAATASDSGGGTGGGRARRSSSCPTADAGGRRPPCSSLEGAL